MTYLGLAYASWTIIFLSSIEKNSNNFTYIHDATQCPCVTCSCLGASRKYNCRMCGRQVLKSVKWDSTLSSSQGLRATLQNLLVLLDLSRCGSSIWFKIYSCIFITKCWVLKNIFLLLFSFLKMFVFKLCSSTTTCLFFFHLSLPHNHKSLGITTL